MRTLVILSVILFSGCAGVLHAPMPLRSVAHAAPIAPAHCLIVFLPGMGDRAETFEKRGFVQALRDRQLSADVLAADATFGYYRSGTFLQRLSTDVIGPAKAKGYREIWLIGPSMGGFGSLFYSRAHAAEITGVLAIAPYLGGRKIISQIKAAGGLKNWSPPPRVETPDEDNFQEELWRWLQAATQGREPSPLLFAGYGKDDRLSAADSLLTAELPPSRVFLTDGGHVWPAWHRILTSFLDSPEFASRCR